MVYKSNKKKAREIDLKGANKDYLYFVDKYGHFNFRSHFKAARMAKGISLLKLQAITGVAASSLSMFERGKKDMCWGSLERVISALDCFPILVGNYMYYDESMGRIKRNNKGWYPHKEEIKKLDYDGADDDLAG